MCHIVDKRLYDVHADLSEEVLVKVSITFKNFVSPFEIHDLRKQILLNPIRVEVESSWLTSVGTLVRKDTKLRVCLPRSHRLFSIPIYMDHELLQSLKRIVTVEESSVIQRATGVPGIVYLRQDFERFADRVERRMATVGTTLGTMDDSLRGMRESMAESVDTVAEGIVEKIDREFGTRAIQSGMVSSSNLKRVIEEQLEGRDRKLMKNFEKITSAYQSFRRAHDEERGPNHVFDLHLEEDDAAVPPGAAPDAAPDVAPDAAPDAAPDIVVRMNWPRQNHFHRSGPGAGKAWATAMGAVIPRTMSLRVALQYYLNGDSSMQMKPLILITRAELITIRERNLLKDMKTFFERMMADLMVGEYVRATRTTRVSVEEMDGLLENMRAVLSRPPYSFIPTKIGRAREGHARTESTDCAFASVMKWIRCSSIIKYGSEEDKDKLHELRGCGRHNNGRQCKFCKEFLRNRTDAEL
jgi:hypothetical protein